MTDPYLPVDVVFHPNWWNKNYDLSFDRDFYYEPKRRARQEQQMRQLLYERFGDIGLGKKDAPRRPIVGPILMGSGYIVQEILGCEIHRSWHRSRAVSAHVRIKKRQTRCRLECGCVGFGVGEPSCGDSNLDLGTRRGVLRCCGLKLRAES